LLKVNGVKKADVDWKKGEAKVVYDSQKAGVEQLIQAVAKAGFKAISVQ
jgi:copper chaperone CopZ